MSQTPYGSIAGLRLGRQTAWPSARGNEAPMVPTARNRIVCPTVHSRVMQLYVTKLTFVVVTFPGPLSGIRSRNISGSNMTDYRVLFLAEVLYLSPLIPCIVVGYQPAFWRNLPHLSGLKVEAADSLETFVATSQTRQY